MLQLNQELDQDESRSLRYQVGSPLANSPPGWFFELLNILCHWHHEVVCILVTEFINYCICFLIDGIEINLMKLL